MKTTFYRTVLFKICKMYTFGVNVVYKDILFMHKTYSPSIFSVLLQFKDLISENMKIS